MKSLFSSFLIFSGVALLVAASAAFGQTTGAKDSASVRPGVTVRRVPISPEQMKKIMEASVAGATVPLWNYSVVSPLDSNTYTGTMIGRDPGLDAHVHRTTTIDFYLVPLILKFPNSGPVFDPTTANTCNVDNNGNDQSSLFFVENSPEFVASSITINGVNEGTVQYTDAFQRGNFNGVPPNTTLASLPYHTKYNLIVAAAQTINVPSTWSPTSSTSLCGTQGSVDVGKLDAYLQGTAIPAVQNAGTTSVIMFLVDSVYETLNGAPYSAGYHTVFFPGGGTVPQVYGISEWNSAASTIPAGLCGSGCADIDIMSHEIGELTDDPLTNNAAPAWGHIGQVTGCQADVEVGDPLSGTLFSGITLSNFTYHPQELAFFDWFFRISPSRGAGGDYSDNGTFTTDAGAVCM